MSGQLHSELLSLASSLRTIAEMVEKQAMANGSEMWKLAPFTSGDYTTWVGFPLVGAVAQEYRSLIESTRPK